VAVGARARLSRERAGARRGARCYDPDVAAAPSLLLAAFPPELAGLDAAPPAGWRVATTGIGAVVAAAGTARLLAEHRPARVLLVGTCGAYDDRLAPGDLLVAASVIATSIDELEGRAYRPELERTRFEATWALPLALPAHAVAVTPAITTSPEGARRLAAVAAAEHLEAAGVFAACHGAGVPVAAAFAVANRVGPSANAEWRANHARASRALVEALRPVFGE
jgi:purine-nucleoside phosphorylase